MNGYDSIVNIEYNNLLIEAGVRGEELPDDVVNLLEGEADVCPPRAGGTTRQPANDAVLSVPDTELGSSLFEFAAHATLEEVEGMHVTVMSSFP